MQKDIQEIALNEANSMINQPLLLGAIDRILIKKSIAKRVSDIQPLKGPVGIITGAKWDKVTGTLSLAKADVEAITKKIRTEFTVESLQDLQSIYKENFYNLLAHYLVDELMYKIDDDFITMVKTRAGTKTNLVFDGTFDKDLFSVGQSVVINIAKGLADLPISDNRSQSGWAIVSSNIASVIGLTTSVADNNDTVDGGNDEGDNSPSYIGRLNGIDFYIDYTYEAAEEVPEVTAVSQENTVTIGTLVDLSTYSVTVNGNLYELQYVVATHTDVNGYATALAGLVEANTDVSASATTNVISVAALAAGVSYTISTVTPELLVNLETQANIPFVSAEPAGVDYVVFGIKGNGVSKGSTIYSPYKQDWIETTDASTGEQIFFLLDRTAMEINPLDNDYYNGGAGTSAFLGKFNVDFTGMAIFA